MTKGNPKAAEPVSAEQSRRLTFEEVGKSEYVAIDPSDPLATLIACNGFYESPKNEIGAYLGPLVAYAGKYDAGNGEQKNLVGFHYFNVAKAEERPLVRKVFAKLLAEKVKSTLADSPTLLLGMPMGGIVFTAALSTELNLRLGFAEKKVKKLADPAAGIKEDSSLTADRHDIRPGDKVIIVEDVCNNFSTTEKAREMIKAKGGELIGITCIVNRSPNESWEDLPVISLIRKPTLQYRQDSLEVVELVKADKVAWKPKHEWPRLKEAMEKK
jgi:orotate phosphoribosyltransferase